MLASLLAAQMALANPGGSYSAATIAGAFADSCRDFAARSSKDISHVVVGYADGRVVKDERIDSRDYSIDGPTGGEIDYVIVKSGTTRKRFECVRSNDPPAAFLEIETPEACGPFFSGGLQCDQSAARTDWTAASEIPDDGGEESGFLHWGCVFANDPALCPFTITFRATNSADPDDDITSWSIDFGDGTTAGGSWSAAPPTGVAHDYSPGPSGDIGCTGVGTFGSTVCPVTLTVTDSAGQTSSETIVMVFLDQSPD